MPLFQKSVVKKYINELDAGSIDTAFAAFQAYFHNAEIQENIRQAKEEQFQEGFLRELFVSIFGYVLNPQPNFNLTTELKNIANSKKADGAILKNDHAVAVIELKSTQTTDLDSVESQAFGYKNHHPKCQYVIISNFEKVRFYIQNAVEYLEFNLFTLNRDEFARMWLCLAAEHLLNDTPLRMKEASVLQEENVTQKLYADYAEFRSAIFQNMVDNNPHTDKLLLFKKTQKLLDRFLFIFFAEDRLLLPPNSISIILKQWETLKEELDAYVPLYDRFKKYFGYINSGYTGKKYDVFPYNGGLFAPDELLDTIKLDDEILYRYTKNLSAYDFETDVDVNILGHIFEHSLGEIENVQAEIKGEDVDRRKSKRKKDGIFYTPKYITKYIVENTIGRLCEEKRSELAIVDEEYAKGRKNRKKETIKKLDDILNAYRDWLLGLTILDPACGSGAFLNQALDFLIEEHRKIDEWRAQLFNSPLLLSDITNDILEHNIYGVDLNEESVEIAKLSLWLRTAQKGRKLNNLNNNIKCGNSLIDDPAVAGDKAFDWHAEFPDIFKNGGFDVVIGNPPYGASLTKSEKAFLNKKFISGGIDTTISFIQLGRTLLVEKGEFGFIIPKSFTFANNYKSTRELIVNEISEIVDCKKVWKEVKLEQIILRFQKQVISKSFISSRLKKQTIEKVGTIHKDSFLKYKLLLNDISEKELDIAEKMVTSCIFLNDIATNTRGGTFQNKIQDSGELEVIGGAEVQREGINGVKGYIDQKLIKDEVNALIKPNSVLAQNIVAHIENPKDHIKIICTIPQNPQIFIVDTVNQITIYEKFSNKFIFLILNSNLMNWFVYRFIYGKAIRTMHFDSPVTSRIPIQIPKEMNLFEQKAEYLQTLYSELGEKSSNFTNTLKDNYSFAKLSKKLQTFYEHDFATLLAELKKQKISIPLAQQSEWKTFFEQQQQEILALQAEIAKTDAEIDRMVYELYGLTDEEIEIVETSV